MTTSEDLERRVRLAFEEAAAGMDVDPEGGAAGVAARVATRRRRSRRVAALAALGAVAVIAAGLAVVERSGPDESGPSGLVPAVSPRPDQPTGRPYLLDVDSGAITSLPAEVVPPLSGNSVSYALSPDGEWLAWASRALRPTGASGSSGGLVRLDGTERIALPVTPVEGLAGVVWSPDADRVAYQVNDGSPLALGRIEVFDLATRETRVLVRPALRHANFWSLVYDFTADGRALVYDLPRDPTSETRWDIWTVPVAGGEPRRILEDARAPEPLPDGSGLAFVEPTRGSWAGQAVRLHTGATAPNRVVVVGRVGIGWAHASPDSERIAYTDLGTWVVGVHTGVADRVTRDDLHGWVDDHTLLVSTSP